MANIDKTDVRILNELKANARATLSELAEAAGITADEAGERIAALENSAYIKGYYADVDLEKIGYRIKAFIMLQVKPEDQHRFYDFIQREDCVLECDHITGQYSMLLKTVFPSMNDLDIFIGRLQEYGRTETQIVFSTVLERH